MTPTINVQVGREHQEQQQNYDSLWLFFMNCCCASTHVAHIMHMCQTMLSKFSDAVCAHIVRKVWKGCGLHLASTRLIWVILKGCVAICTYKYCIFVFNKFVPIVKQVRAMLMGHHAQGAPGIMMYL
jgi:hypothetical protein